MAPDAQPNGTNSMPPPPQGVQSTSTTSRSRRSSFHPHPPLSPSLSNSEQNLPSRHPRPLTPAELHNELEKEQEAMVNRLTRELSVLRAHSASVASTASATSNAPFVVESTDSNSFVHPLPLATGPTHPSGARNRSSSTASSNIGRAGRSASNSVSAGTAGAVSTTARFEEISQHRQELEAAKRENEQLKRRIMDLESQLRERRVDAGA